MVILISNTVETIHKILYWYRMEASEKWIKGILKAKATNSRKSNGWNKKERVACRFRPTKFEVGVSWFKGYEQRRPADLAEKIGSRHWRLGYLSLRPVAGLAMKIRTRPNGYVGIPRCDRFLVEEQSGTKRLPGARQGGPEAKVLTDP